MESATAHLLRSRLAALTAPRVPAARKRLAVLRSQLAALVSKGKATPPATDSPQQTAELIADILGGLLGEDALLAFENEAGAKRKHATRKASKWNEIDHPRGHGGRFIKAGSTEAVATAHAQIAKLKAEKPTPANTRKLLEHLSILTVKQLHELKKQHGLKASGRLKAELVRKIAERLPGAGKGPAEPRARPRPPRKPLDPQAVVARAQNAEYHPAERPKVLRLVGKMDSAGAAAAYEESTRYMHGVIRQEPKTVAEAQAALQEAWAARDWQKATKPDGVSDRDFAVQHLPRLAALGGTLQVADVDKPDVKRHLLHLSAMSEEALNRLAGAGLRGVTISGKSVADYDPSLRGVEARGWKGETWDQIAGAYDVGNDTVVAGSGKHGSHSLAIHELGHAIGHLQGYNHHADLDAAHRRLYAKLPPYLQQGGPGGAAGKEELLAESLADLIVLGEPWATKAYDAEHVAFLKDKVLKGVK